MKKLLATLTTVAMLATTTSVFATEIANDAGYKKADGTYSIVSDLSEVEGQLTLLIIPAEAYLANEIEDEDILYIDQGEYAEGLFQSVGILGGKELKAGTYYAKIGGKELDGIIVEKFTIAAGGQGTPFDVGDTDGNGNITIGDVTTLVDKVLNKIQYFTKGEAVLPAPVGDTDGNGNITIGDVTTLVDKVLNKIEAFEKPVYTLPAGTTAESTYNN